MRTASWLVMLSSIAPSWAAEQETRAFTTENIEFHHDGLALAATIFLPQQGDALCGIAIIQGSGASGRENRWATQFAESFAARGLAVLLPDKRGVGESHGDWRSAGFEELAGDAAASLDALRRQPRVHPQRVGFLGLSQGGHIAPLAASRSEKVAFVINAVGSLVVMEDQLYHELANEYRRYGLGEDTIEYLQGLARASFDHLRGDPDAWSRYIALHQAIGAGPLAPAVASWPDSKDDVYWTRWGKIFDYDPMPHWRELVIQRDVPALVIFGERDELENVPVKDSARRAESLLEDPDFTLRIYPDSGHALFEPGTHRLRDDMLAETARWLADTVPCGARDRSR